MPRALRSTRRRRLAHGASSTSSAAIRPSASTRALSAVRWPPSRMAAGAGCGQACPRKRRSTKARPRPSRHRRAARALHRITTKPLRADPKSLLRTKIIKSAPRLITKSLRRSAKNCSASLCVGISGRCAKARNRRAIGNVTVPAHFATNVGRRHREILSSGTIRGGQSMPRSPVLSENSIRP
jgi:hypothetical protein